MLRDFLPGALMFGLILFLVCHRVWLLRKTSGWRPVSAIVTDVRSQALGDDITVFVDAEFVFDGLSICVNHIATDCSLITDHPKGSRIWLLVDPQNPQKCIHEKIVSDLQR